MPEICPECSTTLTFAFPPRECPYCGFHIREHSLANKVDMLEEANAGWKAECNRLKLALEAISDTNKLVNTTPKHPTAPMLRVARRNTIEIVAEALLGCEDYDL